MGRSQLATEEPERHGFGALKSEGRAHRRSVHHHVAEAIDIAHGHQGRDSFRQFLSREWDWRVHFCPRGRDRLYPGKSLAQRAVGDVRLVFGEDARGRVVLAAGVDEADQHVAAVRAVVTCDSAAFMASLVVRFKWWSTRILSRPSVQMPATSGGTFERLVSEPLMKKSSSIIS